MNLTYPTPSSTDRLIAGSATAFFLLGAYLALRLASLPAVELQTETYEDINWTRFRPQPKKIIPAPRPVKPPEPEKQIQAEPPPPAAKAIVKIDLSALASQLDVLGQPAPARKKVTHSKSGDGARKKVQLDVKKSSMLSGLNTLLGDASQRLRLPERPGRGGKRSTGATLQAGSGSSADLKQGGNYGTSGATLQAPEGKSETGAVAQVEMVDMAGFGQGFADLSPLYHPLVDWMKKHPVRLPEVVRRFMEGTAGDLTSVVSFQIGGREFEMFMMCKQNLNEIRLCLVEDDRSTYLIDRGFKEQSSFLRTGSVNRAGDGALLAFGTTRQAASNQRTDEFYQIFLSWWDSVK